MFRTTQYNAYLRARTSIWCQNTYVTTNLFIIAFIALVFSACQSPVSNFCTSCGAQIDKKANPNSLVNPYDKEASRLTRGVGLDYTSMNITVFNPTEFPRTEYLIFGSEDSLGQLSYAQLPKSFLNVGRVSVPRYFDGEVAILAEDSSPFTAHPAIISTLSKGLEFKIWCNGESASLAPVQNLVSHSRVRIDLFRARTTSCIAELITYTFHNQPGVRFELAVFAESFSTPSLLFNVKFSLEGAGAGNVYNVMRYADPGNLVNRVWDDSAGALFHGHMLFFDEQTLLDPVQSTTMLAQYKQPLYGKTRWTRWGAWESRPPAVPRIEVLVEYTKRFNLPYWDPLAHVGGELGNKMPADTGDQGGFGTWKNIMTVGSESAALMYLDALAVCREFARPVNYFELDGSHVEKIEHPRWFTWSQRTHWHGGVSTDRLYRTHNYSAPNGWLGYDRQHDTSMAIANQVLLNGSMASMRWLNRKAEAYLAGETVPSLYGYLSINSADGGGRGWGRPLLGMLYTWMATGDNALLERVNLRVKEIFDPLYRAANNNLAGPMRVIRLISGDARVLGGRTGWIVWEDCIAVMGMDAMHKALSERNLYPESVAILEKAIWEVGKTIVNHGWMKDRFQLVNHYFWDGTGVPHDDALYSDPFYVASADGTDYKSWALPTMEAVYKRCDTYGDPVTKAKALQYINLIKGLNRPYERQYMGVLGAQNLP